MSSDTTDEWKREVCIDHACVSSQPPIQVYGVEGRYATALFSAASKQKKLDQVEQELVKVSVSHAYTTVWFSKST